MSRLLAILAILTPVSAAEPNQVDIIADRVVAIQVSLNPAAAYLHDLPLRAHDSFGVRDIGGLARAQSELDRLQAALMTIDASTLPEQDAATYAITAEFLEAERGLRVCRNELWAVNHMFGWHRLLPTFAERQPVGTPAEREQALTRWRSLPRWVAIEIDNLRHGLEQGYSAPQSVVRKVIRQIEAMVVRDARKSPVYSPAERANEPAFVQAYEHDIRAVVNPALERYRHFLEAEYLPKARTQLAISAHPNGRECYAASLRQQTTLSDAPAEIMKRGKAAVSRNLAEIAVMTGADARNGDVSHILQAIRVDPANRLSSEENALAVTKRLIVKGRAASARAFEALPRQPLDVVLYPPHLRGSGVSSHYEPGGEADHAAKFMLQTDNWEEQRRSDLEILAFHETFPGHHVQQGLAAEARRHPISKLAGNAAYVEGWARYAEALAEELNLYSNEAAMIQRRAWPARGMVADPGLHLNGWSREQTYQYLLQAGRFSPADTAELIDRMAIMPGQLAAYDAGGLQFVELRQKAEASLNSNFDLAEFHAVVLHHGAVPLPWLKHLVDRWIQTKSEELSFHVTRPAALDKLVRQSVRFRHHEKRQATPDRVPLTSFGMAQREDAE